MTYNPFSTKIYSQVESSMFWRTDVVGQIVPIHPKKLQFISTCSAGIYLSGTDRIPDNLLRLYTQGVEAGKDRNPESAQSIFCNPEFIQSTN